MVSREIDRRIPTAAKLMISDEPPALRNGQRDAGDRHERDDDRDVDERLDAQPAGDAGREQGAERVGRGQRDARPRVREQRRTAR